ncbi:MAG: polyketide cyclase, partial [Mucilaginibacter sp.]
KGVQEVKKVADGARVDCEIRFERPFKNVAQTYMEVIPISESNTTVKWGMLGENPYPFNLMNLFIPGMLAKDLDTSLGTLKNNLEK